MDIHINDIENSYVYLTDTEEHKNDIINKAIEDNKETCYVVYGTGDINSNYQPIPNKEPDYYMKYCNSDNYDYFKDYRLVWGYGIGIIETDVIVNTDTGEHLAEGAEACDSYVAPDGINTKRGIWLRFSGNNFKDVVKIQEVVLPKEIISIKNLTNSLTSRRLEIYGFNSENIINWDYAFAEDKIYSDNPNRSIYFNDYVYNLSSTKCMNGTFNVAIINSLTDNNKLYCTNIPENIVANYGFYYCKININIEDLCSNYIGGNYFLYSHSYNSIYTYHLENFKLTSYDNTFYVGNFYFHNTIIKLNEGNNNNPFKENYSDNLINFFGFPTFINNNGVGTLYSYSNNVDVKITNYPGENSILIDFTKFRFVAAANRSLFNVLRMSANIDIKIDKDSHVSGNFFNIESGNFSINFVGNCFCNNNSEYSLFIVRNTCTINGNIGGTNFITLNNIDFNSKINIINKKENDINAPCIIVKQLNQYIINNITYDNTFFNPFLGYTGAIDYPEFDDTYIPTVNFEIDDNFKTIQLNPIFDCIVLKANINTDNYTFSEDKVMAIFYNGTIKYINANFTKKGWFYFICTDYLKITNVNAILNKNHLLNSNCDVIANNYNYVHSCNKLYINYFDVFSYALSDLNDIISFGCHININFTDIYIVNKPYESNYIIDNGIIYIEHKNINSLICLPFFIFYNDENNNVINENLRLLNEDESDFNFSNFKNIMLNGYINIKASLMIKEIYNANSDSDVTKGFLDVVPNLKIINDTENDIITIGDNNNHYVLKEITNDFSMFHWYGNVTSSYKENPTTACLLPSIIEDSVSDDYFCLNEELTFINCRSESNYNIFQLGTNKYYLSNIKILNLQLHEDINTIYINNQVVHTGDNLEIINITNSSNNHISEFHLDYCDGLTEDMINNIINYDFHITKLYINETFYSKFTSEQLQQLTDKNITLISIRNE